ncbi:MAG: hypothetical protein GXO25_07470 [Euryarchaeota archaeon]|nr:hypothetical protein [Euryarchaeota archaeon]
MSEEARTLGERPVVHTHELFGIVLIILGIVAMTFPKFTTNLILGAIAIILILAGAVFALLTYRSKERTIGAWLKAALLIIFGILIFAHPYAGAIGLTLIVFLLLLGASLISFYWAYSSRENPSWWFMAVSGTISLVLAVLLIWGIFRSNPWIVGIYIGINLFVDGLMLLLMGRYLKKVEK